MVPRSLYFQVLFNLPGSVSHVCHPVANRDDGSLLSPADEQARAMHWPRTSATFWVRSVGSSAVTVFHIFCIKSQSASPLVWLEVVASASALLHSSLTASSSGAKQREGRKKNPEGFLMLLDHRPSSPRRAPSSWAIGVNLL